VVEAVAKATQTMSEDHKRETDTLATNIKNAGETKTSIDQEIRDLRTKDEAMFKAMISVREHLTRRYPGQMESLKDKTRHTSNSRALLRTDDHDESRSEILFKDIVEAFAYLLEEVEKKLAAVQAEAVKKEHNGAGVYIQARRDLIAKHREELEHQADQFKVRIAQLQPKVIWQQGLTMLQIMMAQYQENMKLLR
ncbi:MAG: hypothetical protein EAZ06_10960, partial [Cytophagales bacterium]